MPLGIIICIKGRRKFKFTYVLVLAISLKSLKKNEGVKLKITYICHLLTISCILTFMHFVYYSKI